MSVLSVANTASDIAIASGNPYAMAVGGVVKGFTGIKAERNAKKARAAERAAVMAERDRRLAALTQDAASAGREAALGRVNEELLSGRLSGQDQQALDRARSLGIAEMGRRALDINRIAAERAAWAGQSGSPAAANIQIKNNEEHLRRIQAMVLGSEQIDMAERNRRQTEGAAGVAAGLNRAAAQRQAVANIDNAAQINLEGRDAGSFEKAASGGLSSAGTALSGAYQEHQKRRAAALAKRTAAEATTRGNS